VAQVILAGRYRLIEPLGTGGMSVVWHAYDEVLGRPVAVKLLAPRFAADTLFRDRIRAEAKAAARLAHPNITNVYDFGESPDATGAPVPFVVMELVDGRSLAVDLRQGPLPWRTAVDVCAEIAAALSAAHARGLVHRDVTPANVMRTAAGVKVVDFGVSAVMGESGQDGPVLGTPAFLAPERLAGDPGGPPADVYALGLLLYLTLTGELPWEAETTTQMVSAHRYQPPAPLPPVPGLPSDVYVLCGQCLEKEPGTRPSSAEVARRLADATGIRVTVVDPDGAATGARVPEQHGRAGTRILPWPVPPPDAIGGVALPPAVRRTVWIAVAATLAVGVLVGIGAAVARNRGPAAHSVVPPVSTASPLSTPTPSAVGPAGPCTVSFTAQSWDEGATISLTVANTGDEDIVGWTLTFTLSGRQDVTDGWNGHWEQDGDEVTVGDAGWNADLPVGGSVVVGANLKRHGGSGSAPRDYRLNGVRCTATGQD
jgi:serine/threonine-protein kinase